MKKKVFSFHGVTELSGCDNGEQFKIKEFSNSADKYGIRILFNSNYHPFQFLLNA